jgi:hypothetical protein
VKNSFSSSIRSICFESNLSLVLIARKPSSGDENDDVVLTDFGLAYFRRPIENEIPVRNFAELRLKS